jgi:hypothetical protein
VTREGHLIAAAIGCRPARSSFALIAMLTRVNTWYRPGGRLDVAEIEEIYLGMAHSVVGKAVAAVPAD